LSHVATCLLMILVAFSGCTEKNDSAVTFNADILPIIEANCAGCHNPKGFAPFDLLGYKDVAKRADMIMEVTSTGYMPPWYADSSYRHFANERFISKQEIKTIEKWIAQGKRKGGLFSKRIKLRSANSILASQRISFSLHDEHIIDGDNQEHFIKYIIPFEYENELAIEGLSFTPGSRKYAHHANYGIYTTPENVVFRKDYPPIEANINEKQMDEFSELFGRQVHYSGWIPGSSAVDFGTGAGFMLPKKGVILVTMHYAAAPIEHKENSVLHLYPTDSAITEVVKTISIGSGGIGTIKPELIIPADTIMDFSLIERLPRGIEILYLFPHMHLLGKSFMAYATTKESDTIPLIKINNWDFDWQEGYQLEQPFKLPAFSRLHMQASFDNTSNNPRNPFSPPREIVSTGLMETKKEMMTLVLIYK